MDKGLKYKPQIPPYPNEDESSKVILEVETTECLHCAKGDPLKTEDVDNPPRVSTPIETTCKNPLSDRLREIIFHAPALHIPPVDLTVAPGQRQNIQRANWQLAAMAQNQNRGRGNHNPALQGADPALIQIL